MLFLMFVITIGVGEIDKRRKKARQKDLLPELV